MYDVYSGNIFGWSWRFIRAATMVIYWGYPGSRLKYSTQTAQPVPSEWRSANVEMRNPGKLHIKLVG